MSFLSKFAACLLTGLALAAGPLWAQTVHGPEAEYDYDMVGAWKVTSLSEKAGVFGCRAKVVQGNLPLIIERYRGEWNLVVRSRPQGVFAGGVLNIDGSIVDSQFGLKNGYGIKTLTSQTLGRLRAGNQVIVRVNGNTDQVYSLKGSAAAILKVEECDRLKGEKPTTTAQSSILPGGGAQEVFLTCSSITSAPYACVARERENKPGFVETFDLEPQTLNLSQPVYHFEVLPGAQQAVVWFAFGRAAYRYAGYWNLYVQNNQRCAEPAANQPAEVMRELGQDAWQICMY